VRTQAASQQAAAALAGLHNQADEDGEAGAVDVFDLAKVGRTG
jgi:hypothetical protein